MEWQHIVWIGVMLFSIAWYWFVIRVFKGEKQKKLDENDSDVQKTHIFAKNTSFESDDLSTLIDQIEEDETSPELLGLFEKTDKGVDDKPLIRNNNGTTFKIIKNTEEDSEQGLDQED